jgi:hypothetical protein
MTDDERAALVDDATSTFLDAYNRAGELRDGIAAALAAIEPAIRADEREACARIADAYAEANEEYGAVSYSAPPAIAREIRARGVKP